MKLTPSNLASMLEMIDQNIISVKIAKDIMPDMLINGESPKEFVEKKGLTQISDRQAIEKVIDGVISKNEKSVTDFKSGKMNAIAYLIGQTMKEMRGKANPKIVNEILLNKMNGSNKTN